MQVAAGAAQRLNRHVAVIELYASILRAKTCEPVTTYYHERLWAEAAQANALGRHLLACATGQPIRLQLLSLSDVVLRHQAALRKSFGPEQSLECACPADTPLVWADPQRVRWMLEELAQNARDATPEPGLVNITVKGVDVQQPPPGVDSATHKFASIVVTDTGCGMSREVQQHLGEPFFTTNSVCHPGLGLAGVFGLIKAHGGWLEVTSALGHGTSVRLFFPSVATANSAQTRRSCCSEGPDTSTSLCGHPRK